MILTLLVHAILFLLFWLTNLTFRPEVNGFLAGAIGLHWDFLSIFLFFSLGVAVWCAVFLDRRRKTPGAGLPAAFTGIGVFYLVFFYGSFAVLFVKNPVQVARLGQLLQYFRLFPDALLLLLAAWVLHLLLGRAGRTWQKASLISAFVLLWLIPVFWTPGLVYRGPLPAKPRLMAHRGASTLAPENTLTSMQVASKLGTYGLETDVDISYDGVLFLMHDSTLARTTNIAKIFPGREKDPVENFTWAELSRLDAGGWFQGRAFFPDEPIPTLAQVLQIVQENHLRFICDLRIPPADHPFAAETLTLFLDEIRAAGLASQAWVLASPEEIPVVRAALPGVILAKGLDYGDTPAPDRLVAVGYQLVNSEFGLSNRTIRAYRNVGLWVNIWTVDEPWQYSRLWLVGANSVTSNTIQDFIALSKPVMAMPYSIYLIVWGLIGIGAAAVTCLMLRAK